MRIAIFGTGYVGLTQAAVLADAGHMVLCVDIDANKVDRLTRGEIGIYEPGLERLVKENVAAERLAFTTDADRGVQFAELLMIAVGTPQDEDGSADTSYVLAVARTIAEKMVSPKVIVVKSTVPVGTCNKVQSCIADGLASRGVDIDFDVASNPEFLKEGSAVADCMKPDRILIGTEGARAERRLRELYAPFNRNHEKIVRMDLRSAELTKYTANCLLATKISFMNEIANLADRLGADIEKVRLGIGSDPRIGYQFLYAGLGYGGSCFPKDVRALVHTADTIGFDASVLRAVDERNDRQKHFMVDKVLGHYNGDIAGRTFALWGLAFKPNTNDMREAPARVLMEGLWAAGAKVRAYDPHAVEECRRIYGERPDLTLVNKRDEALVGADALIVATEWRSFQAPDFETLGQALNQRVIFDGRNIYDPEVVAEHGFTLYGVGRGSRIRN